MKIRVGWLAAFAWAGGFASSVSALQDRAAVRAVRVSPDTVQLGDPFTLRASVYVPPGRDLRVPATLLPEWGVESLVRVRAESVEAEDGSVQVVLEYDLIPFEIGLAATPQLEMASGEALPGEVRVRVEDGPEERADPMGPENTQNTQNTQNEARAGQPGGGDSGQSGADTGDADDGPRDRLVVAGRRVFVTSPVLLDDIARGLRPRPPADVVGSSWNLPAVLGASLLSLLRRGVGPVRPRGWLAARARAAIRAEAPPETPDVWRARALAQLDLLLERGDHRAGRPRDFYEDASEVVREYVEHFDAAWSRSWTSTELMRGLSGESGWPDPEALGRAMKRAEMAKFAGTIGEVAGAEGAAVRAEAGAAAERDWREMRGWVDATGQSPVFATLRDAILAESE